MMSVSSCDVPASHRADQTTAGDVANDESAQPGYPHVWQSAIDSLDWIKEIWPDLCPAKQSALAVAMNTTSAGHYLSLGAAPDGTYKPGSSESSDASWFHGTYPSCLAGIIKNGFQGRLNQGDKERQKK